MKINDQKTPGKVPFKETGVGTVFMYEDEYYIKIGHHGEKAVNLKNGAIYTFVGSDAVIEYPDAEVVIK